ERSAVMPMPIETPRFRIRWLAGSDSAVVHRALFEDEEVLKYLPPRMAADTAERTDRRVARWIEARERDGYGWTVIEDRETGEFLGLTGLLAVPDEPGAVELATLLARAAWGKRLATETAEALLGFAFDDANVARVVAFIHPDNAA